MTFLQPWLLFALPLVSLPVIIHSSLTGTTNESHVKSVGADAYVAKFVAEELGATIKQVLTRQK